MRDLIQLWSQASRRLAHRPAFAVLVIGTLALGVGASTAIFSFVDGILLRPLPYPQADRIVRVCETHPDRPEGWCGGSPANWLDWSRSSRTLATVGLGRSWWLGWSEGTRTRGVDGGVATPGLFETFGVEPFQGRLFQPEDLQPGAARAAIVSHAFFARELEGRSDPLPSLVLDGQSHEVVGVLPPGFEVPEVEDVAVWIPLWPERLERRDWRGFRPFARLRDGVTLEESRAEMETLRSRLAAAYPETNAAWGLRVERLLDHTVRPVRPALLMLCGAVTALLLIACSNVAGLLLIQGAGRRRELEIRLALGARRSQVVTQLLAESLVLALLGGALGALLAGGAVALFSKLAPAWLPRLAEVAFDGTALAFGLLLAFASSLLFGLAPALHATLDGLAGLARGGREVGRRGGGRARDLLVVAEIALACLLLVGAGLLLRSFEKLWRWQPGFDADRLLVAQVFSSSGKYPRADQMTELYRRAAAELASLPGVTAVGAGSAGPLFGGDGEQELWVEGEPVPPPGGRSTAAWFDVEPGYFQALGRELLEGRDFEPRDDAEAPRVAIVSATLARRLWGERSPLGQRLHLALQDMTVEVVGVVSDERPFRPDVPPEAQVFWPFAQLPRWAITFFVRTEGPSSGVIAAARARLATVDPDLQIGTMLSVGQLAERERVSPLFHLSLLGMFAVLATSIALVGIYSVTAFSVAQRSREIGLRMALGAERRQVLALVTRRGAALAVVGLLVGSLGAWALTRYLSSLLVGVSPHDLPSFAASALLLFAAAFLACHRAALGATRVDPLIALRQD